MKKTFVSKAHVVTVKSSLGTITEVKKDQYFFGSYTASYLHPDLESLQGLNPGLEYQVICSNISRSNQGGEIKLSPFGVVWGWTSHNGHKFNFSSPEEALIDIKSHFAPKKTFNRFG